VLPVVPCPADPLQPLAVVGAHDTPDGGAMFERATEVARGLTENVREWADQSLGC
jgi:hypothetical protein